MAGRLSGARVVVLLAEGFEDLEFWVTVMRLQEEGAEVTVAGLTTEPVQGKNGLEATADVEVAAVSADNVDLVSGPPERPGDTTLPAARHGAGARGPDHRTGQRHTGNAITSIAGSQGPARAVVDIAP